MSTRRKFIKPPIPEGTVCHYCPDDATTWDHIVPRTLLGSDEEYNLVPSCEECNENKKDHWPSCSCLYCTAAVLAYASKPGFIEYALEQSERNIRFRGRKTRYRDTIDRIRKVLTETNPTSMV